MFYISVALVVLMEVFNFHNETISLTVLGVTSGMMIFSLVNYAIIFFRIQKQNKMKEKDLPSVQASITDDK